MKWKIIKQFSGKNTFGFKYQDVLKEFPEKNPVYLAITLAGMVEKGMLCKIARNTYHIIPADANLESYFPGQHQVAKYIMRNKEYYIGYASALEIHGLEMNGQSRVPLIQAGDREYVVTRKQMKPAIRNLGGITYQFIKHDTNRFFGFESMWINQLEKAMVSDLEKSIVDIATKPQLCGGIIEVGNAIFTAKERTDHDKLFYYFARNGNKSARKRFLFLTELLGLEWTAEHDLLKKELGTGFSLLDPSAQDQGIKQKKYGLKINVDPVQIKKEVLNPIKS